MTQVGTLKANAAAGLGGNISVIGDAIELTSASLTAATGATGGGEILVGGGLKGADLPKLAAVHLATARAKTVNVHEGATLDASATGKGQGGTIVAYADKHQTGSKAIVAGRFKAEGGPDGGDGGFVETSAAKVSIADSASVSTVTPLGNTGTWLVDPRDFTIATSGGNITGVALTNALKTSNYTIGGLVGSNNGSGTIEYAHSTSTVAGHISNSYSIGGLAGNNNGAVEHSYATGGVTGQHDVGGLVGNNNSLINDSNATGNVVGQGLDSEGYRSYDIGGLAGYNEGNIKNSYAQDGFVTGHHSVGGLTGYNNGVISNSHAKGTVFGSAEIDKDSQASYRIGGLVGTNNNYVENSWADGSVSGDHNVGGLMGYNNNYSIFNIHWLL